MIDVKLRVISLGAGVQSTTLALMAARGEVGPMPDCAIFADTGAEPLAVYKHLDWLEKELPFPVYRVSAGNLRDEIVGAMAGNNRMDARPPFFVRNVKPAGTIGIHQLEISEGHLANIIADGAHFAFRKQYHRVPNPQAENATNEPAGA